jgi:hypothetical protein
MKELLKWPEAEEHSSPRTAGPFRVGAFKTEKFLREELYKISARDVVLMTFHPEKAHRRDGFVRVDSRAPVHPGVILEFEKPELTENGDTRYIKMRLPCDTYRFWEDNLRAIAMVLEGLRMIDRHGIRQGAQYQGYLALPPKPGEITLEEAAEFVAKQGGVDGAASVLLKHSLFTETAYKTAAKHLHPDKPNGDAVEFAKLEKAMSMIREHFQGVGSVNQK